LGIDLPGERPGLVPNPEWKKIAEPSNPIWRVGDTYNVSIGQGGVKVTPLQMAALVSAIANGGRLYKPYLLDSVIDVYSGAIQKNNPQLIREGMVGEDVLEEVRKGMRKTVTGGTAGRLAGLPVASAAKTGTAQAGSGIPHAWVTVFAPYENPEIAVTVMVEHAGEGSTVAVPITYEILKYYFENQK
jgi:penicillin-binding protein 2